jgi:hypothetical protein
MTETLPVCRRIYLHFEFEGSESIQAFKPGNLKSVTVSVKELVAQLNEWHMGKRGRVNLVPTPAKWRQPLIRSTFLCR